VTTGFQDLDVGFLGLDAGLLGFGCWFSGFGVSVFKGSGLSTIRFAAGRRTKKRKLTDTGFFGFLRILIDRNGLDFNGYWIRYLSINF
jgi:hypothetical protein